MAANIKIVLNHGAVADLLKGSDIKADIARRCAAIAASAAAGGGEFGHDAIVGKNRIHGMVWTEDFDAMRAEATGRALTRAIDAGRG